MPLYQFDCACGHRFNLLRSIAARDDPAPCTACKAPAARAMIAPRLAVLSSTARMAHQRNERSAHAPRHLTREPVASAHPAPAGAHAHSHGRPWMLGH